MKKKKIICVVGTRPEAIKMSPVIKSLQSEDEFDVYVLSTAQHRNMLDQILSVFDIQCDMDLNIMSADQSLCQSTSRALEGVGMVLDEQRPDFLFVQGDTNTALAGALAGHYHKVPVGHVEAGLRTEDRYHPFPEEMNRRLISKVASLHFAPTQTAVNNLRMEGVAPKSIFLTGNTVIDAVLWISKHNNIGLPVVAQHALDKGRKLILVTAHRRENLDHGLYEICMALIDIVRTYNEVEIVYPVHLNPRVQETVKSILGDKERIHLINPLGYAEFIKLLQSASLILSDSGGVQEEAPTFGVPVLILREVTERNEAVQAGVAKLVGTSREKIFSAVTSLLNREKFSTELCIKQNPFGDGWAAAKIVKHVKAFSSQVKK